MQPLSSLRIIRKRKKQACAYWLIWKTWASPFQHTGLVTARAHLAKSPDIASRVIKSFIEGIQLATVNSEVAKRALRKHMRLQHERDLDDAYQILRGFMPRKPSPTLDGFKMVFAELADQI